MEPGESMGSNNVEQTINNLIQQYSSGLRQHVPGRAVVEGIYIALTGATGSVGSHVLDQLLRRTDIKKIFILNRWNNEDQKQRIAKAFVNKGLDPSLLDTTQIPVAYLAVDFSRPDFGLPVNEFEELRNYLTHIIHSAWNVNLVQPLSSFEKIHIAGVRHLIDLALSSPQSRPPRLVFLSTIGAAVGYKGPVIEPASGVREGQILVPEGPVKDPSIPMPNGYCRSKYVCERIIVEAVEAKIGLRATICRVGQISGATTTGVWARNEYLPVLFRSMIALGSAPDFFPPWRMVPADIAGSTLIKQAFADTSDLLYFAVESPFPTQWALILSALSEFCSHLEILPTAKWINMIKEKQDDKTKATLFKLIPLILGRFSGLASLGWEDSVIVAPELLQSVITKDLLKLYIARQLEIEQQTHGRMITDAPLPLN
ncbi:hypothetical protein M422DRAFT_44181 [Sphaerobolus stellatus SS14]|nr:hypothetical protein M422DRAFT_44181 [Sphaerobolus stellatus SS14]